MNLADIIAQEKVRLESISWVRDFRPMGLGFTQERLIDQLPKQAQDAVVRALLEARAEQIKSTAATISHYDHAVVAADGRRLCNRCACDELAAVLEQAAKEVK